MRHEGGVNAVAFSPDGQIVVTASGDTARFWNVPPPAADEADPKRPHLRLSIEVRTGSELDENSGTIKWLTQAEWLKRQARLWKEFHGPCDVRTWDQASDDEKRRLRTPSKE
jgi:WD40 repeat protein